MILEPGDIAIDYSSARPDPAKIVAAGVRLVVRYDSPNPANTKNLTVAEAGNLLAVGLGLLVVFESSSLDPLHGATLGAQHGRAHEQHLAALGYPGDVPSIVAVDFDTQLAQTEMILDYVRAFNDDTSRPLWVYGEADLVDVCVLRGVAVAGWQTVAWSHHRISIHANCLQHATLAHPQVGTLGNVDDNTVLHPFKAWSTTPDPLPIGDDMSTVTFEVTGLPGIYMWTPGSDPVPFTNPTDLSLLAVGLDAKALTAPLSNDMYLRLFVKPQPVTVNVPPVQVTVPPGPTKFTGTLS
jgi:hypothetical protein